MKYFKKVAFVFIMLLGSITATFTQGKLDKDLGIDHSYKPLKLNLSEDGSKYIRFLMWHQLWVTTNNLSDNSTRGGLTASIRRSRVLAFSQVSPRFLILTHFGLNSLTPGNLTSLGNNGDSPQLFLHGAWGELMITKSIYVGAGLHYWNGLTRLASASTLNFMTLDQSRPFTAWHSLGVSDQFARHLGVYVKGTAGKIEYRFAWNNPSTSSLGGGQDFSAVFAANGEPRSTLTYTGVSQKTANDAFTGNNIFQGYVKYNFWDNESTKLPYYVGTYLGQKKVLALGAGFFLHPDGMFSQEQMNHEDVRHFAVDVYMDLPTRLGALNAYLALQQFNYGDNYISRWGGTGTTIYGQVGYFFKQVKLMPYAAFSSSDYEGADDAIGALDVGLNYFINGHNCKLSAEYHTITNDFREGGLSLGGVERLSQFRLQLHVFL